MERIPHPYMMEDNAGYCMKNQTSIEKNEVSDEITRTLGVPRELDESEEEYLKRLHKERDALLRPDSSVWTSDKPVDAGGSDRFLRKEVVGRGGRGEVWSGIQVSLGRIVAIKSLQEHFYERVGFDPLKVGQAEMEFLQEALISAMLEHPNIVPVYDHAIDDRGRPILAMKMVRGEPWSVVLERDFPELEVREYLARHLPILIDMIQAVAFAHSVNVVHRDLKPAQVMLGEFGEVLLLDWGMALFTGDRVYGVPREVKEALEFLRTPDTASIHGGTPALMAPEQALGHSRLVSPSTDIYLLGGTLYYLLTGKYPHAAETSAKTIELARKGDVVRPELRAPDRDVPKELADLAMHALQYDPDKRIGSAKLFAERLQEYLSGSSLRREAAEFVSFAAEHVEKVEQNQKHRSTDSKQQGGAQIEENYRILTDCMHALQRARGLWNTNPEIPGILRRVLLCYVEESCVNGDLRLARAMALQLPGKEDRGVALARVKGEEARNQRLATTRRVAIAASFILLLSLIAVSYVYTNRLENANTSLLLEMEAADQARTAAELARNTAQTEQYFTGIMTADAFAEDGRTNRAEDILLNRVPLEKRGWEWEAVLSEAVPDAMTLFKMPTSKMILDASWSHDGNLIATGDNQNRLKIWDSKTGNLLRSSPIGEKQIWHARFSPDGSRILVCNFDTNAYIVDSATLDIIHTLQDHEEYLRGGTFSPDGQIAITTSRDRQAMVWDATTGEHLKTIRFPEGNPLYDVAFSPDGQRFAIVGAVYMFMYDTASMAAIREFPQHPENILDLDFSPDGSQIVTACTDRNARIFSAETAEELLLIPNETSWLMSVDWSPDGKYIATGDYEGDARIWDAATGEKIHTNAASPIVYKVQFSPDSQWLITISNAQVSLWPVPPRETILEAEPIAPTDLPQATVDYTVTAFCPPLELRKSWYNYDRRWRISSGRHDVHYDGDHIGIDTALAAISPDGKQRVIINDNTITGTAYANETGEVLHQFGPLYQAVYSPDGKYLAVSHPTGDFELFDAQSFEKLRTLGPPAPFEEGTTSEFLGDMEFHPNGRYLFRGTHDAKALLIDVETGDIIHDLTPTSGYIYTVAFSPDGSLCAAAGFGANTGVWNVETGELISTLRGDENYILGLSFNSSNDRIITASHSDTVKLWEVETGREIMTVLSYPDKNFLLGARFDPSGRRIIAVNSNLTVEVRDIFPVPLSASQIKEELPLEIQVELAKRQARYNRSVDSSDIDLYGE